MALFIRWRGAWLFNLSVSSVVDAFRERAVFVTLRRAKGRGGETRRNNFVLLVHPLQYGYGGRAPFGGHPDCVFQI